MYPYFRFTLPSYTVLAFVGGFFALIYTYFRIDKFNVLFTDLIKIFIMAAAGAYIGGTALFIVTQIPPLLMNFSILTLIHLFTHSGIVFYGGLFGVLLALKIYAKHSRYEEAAIFRMAAPAIPLFHGFGRIGCLLAGCCYGKELSEPLKLFNAVQIDRIPTQIFEAIFEFIIFFVMIVISKKRKDWDILKIYLLSYAIFRFVNEFFRGDEVRGIFLLSTSQWVSAAIIVYFTVKWFRKGNDAKVTVADFS